MKYLLSIIIIFTSIHSSFSQTQPKDSSLPYLKNPTLPPIKIIQSIQGTDTSWFTNSNLVKGKSTIIIYFSPDCGHCQFEAKEMVKERDSLTNANFVWVSYHPMEDIVAFTEKYKLSKLANCVVGRDPKYFIPAFFRVEFTPFIAVYNAQGHFVKEFRDGAKVSELFEAIQ